MVQPACAQSIKLHVCVGVACTRSKTSIFVDTPKIYPTTKTIYKYIYIYIYNWQQYYPKLIFLDIYVYIKRNEVGDPIASYGRKAVVDNTRKILYI